MKRALQISVIVLSLLGGWWVLNNQYTIGDWIALRNYDPPDYVVQFADDTDMSDYGRKVFYVAKPELNDSSQFNDNCPFPERSIILGCYSNSHIYVFNVEDERLEGVEEVTAAHEMLHAAYERLSGSERRELDSLLSQQFEVTKDTRILELIDQYRASDPDSLPNEMHSIFGTEVTELLPELEEHYSQYFEDRSVVVAIAKSYEKVFIDIEEQIASLDLQLDTIKGQISALEAEIVSLQAQLDAESARLDALRDGGDIGAYNAGVPGYNTMVGQYNAKVDRYKNFVASHNTKVEERNSLASTQNELVQSLDSKFEKL